MATLGSKVVAVASQPASTTIKNVTAGKGGTALSIFGVLMVGWLFVTGRLRAVGRIISEGPGALDQLLERRPGIATGQEGRGGALSPAPIGGVFPGSSLPGTPPLAPGPGAVPRVVRLHLPNRKNPKAPPIDVEVQAGPTCLSTLKRLAMEVGYGRVEAEAIALNACRMVGPVPVGGG